MWRAFRRSALVLLLTPSLAKADVDWRQKGAVTPVKNQGQLCASWAFAVTGVVEGALAIRGTALRSLSEQQLVDCASPGCGGPSGDTCTCAQIGCFFDYVQMNGECSGADYPYTARIDSCTAANCTPVVPSGFASNWQRLAGEPGIAGALNSAPVLARLEVGDNGQTLQSFLDYHGGIYTSPGGDASVVQWVLLVGYTAQYFIVKNSFGTSWGASGYLYLGRGANRLGVGNFAYSLQPGPATSGACSLPGGTCFEMNAEDCAAASGTFSGVGTFCPTTGQEGACTSAPAGAPTLTPEALIIGMILLAVTAAWGIRRRTR